MSQPAISKHLSVLENAGLVWCEKRGDDHIAELPCADQELQNVWDTLASACPSCTRPKSLHHTGKALTGRHFQPHVGF